MYSRIQTEFEHRQPQIEPSASTSGSHQPGGTDLIGRPILFATGQFAGQTIRAELQEVQQAELGRKYARVDRRPLDPPPVVQLRLFHVSNAGTSDEIQKEIKDYDEVQILGLLCTVDLFPVPAQSVKLKDGSGMQKPLSAPPTQTSFSFNSTTSSHARGKQKQDDFSVLSSYPYPESHASGPSAPTNGHIVRLPTHFHTSHSPPEIVHYIGDYAVTENSKMTHALVGATFVQPATVEFQGKKAVMFVFADLAVKVEGTFVLRYRSFDIFSKPYNHDELVIQAECYGQPFRVYSTKEFPGLQASTELTKHLARWGVRLNTRETERKRRKKGEARSASPLYAGSGKRKHPSDDYTHLRDESDQGD